MKRTTILLLVLLFALSSVSAFAGNQFQNQNRCNNHGSMMETGACKCNNGWVGEQCETETSFCWIHTSPSNWFAVDVTGTDPIVAEALCNEVNGASFEYKGRTYTAIQTEIRQTIKHCTILLDASTFITEAPEFSTIGAGIAILGSLGVFIYKRH